MKKTVKDALQRIFNILQSVSRFFHILLIAAYKRLLSNSFSKNIFDLLALTAAMYIGWLTSGNKIDFCSGLLIPVISLTIGITLRVGLHFYINAMLVNTGRKFIFSDTETANLIQDKDSLFFK